MSRSQLPLSDPRMPIKNEGMQREIKGGRASYCFVCVGLWRRTQGARSRLARRENKRTMRNSAHACISAMGVACTTTTTYTFSIYIYIYTCISEEELWRRFTAIPLGMCITRVQCCCNAYINQQLFIFYK